MDPRRRNLVKATRERWKPPLMLAPNTRWRRFSATIRRFFDLQLGSIWNDLAPELANAKGLVLDVGCGAQPFRSLLPADVKYVGIDTANAGEHFGYDVPDVIYYSANQWPVDDESVDIMLITETLEHVFDVEQFLSEAARCLRPGGRLIASVPFAARWHFIPHDYWRYTPSSLNLLLDRAGFDEVGVYARGNSLTVACYKNMALFLPLLFPQSGSPLKRLIKRLGGLIVSPLFVLLALTGNVSLGGRGRDDCLGYTVLARRAVADVGGVRLARAA